jgi:hypothetical protein
VADHGEVEVLSVAAVVAEAAAAVVAAVLLAAVPSAAAKAAVVAEAKEVADLLGAAGLISPVLPVQAVRFSGAAPLSEVHLPEVPIILVVAPEVLPAVV